MALVALVALLWAAPAQVRLQPATHFHVDGPPGLYFTITCTHGTIKFAGSSVCHDQTVLNYGFCGSGTCSTTMTETTDTGHTFTKFTTSGGACMGTTGVTCSQSSTSTSVNLWGTANGITHQTGSVTLNTT